MSFAVESADLGAYGKQVDRAAEDAQSVDDYVKKYGRALGNSSTEQGLLLAPLELHEQAMDDAGKALSRVHTLLDRSGAELTRSGAYYRDTDAEQAAKVDATYPDAQRAAAGNGGGGATQSFSDATEPSSRLSAPSKPEEYSHGLVSDAVGAVSDWLSPSYWSLEAIKFVFQAEQDPLEQALGWFAGDWESYAKCAEMWQNSGSALGDLGANIRSGNQRLDQSWNGNAADAAYKYFDELAKRITEVGTSLKDLQGHYSEISLAVYEALNLVKGVLTAIADALILIEIEVAAGTLLAETGVGAVVGYGLAALEVVKVIRLWGQATEAYSAAEQSVKIAVAAAAALSGTIGVAVNQLPAVGESYDHPAV
ncbi:hypothetical protein [Streptomyces sp. NPDC002790]|uniref:hypothetical protein n=1 Tax=Streptomyces sp. NPDC002790 TaxID=3154431 RepID=UPI00331A484C